MAFEGNQSTFANALFPTFQPRAGVNVGGGGGNNDGAALPFSIPGVSLQEQDTSSYVPWSYNTDDDPYGLISCAQSSTKSRKPTEHIDCDGETDLQGLVSNILDEADSQESYYSEGCLPTSNPVWSPKTLRDELLQYFQSEAKMQYSPLNYASRESVSKAQGQSLDKEFSQHSNGLATSQPWLFNLPNGDRDSYTPRPQKLPPGLPVSNVGNACLSQIQQNTMSADKDRGNSQNHFPDLSDVFLPQSENNSFHPYFEDHYIQNSAKTTSSEQYMPQDINHLVSSFQSFMAGEHDGLCRGDFPNMHRQTGMRHEESMAEQWKITGPAMQTQKQLVGEFGTAQMERNGDARNQTFKCNAFQDVPAFSPQNFQQPNQPFPGSFNLPNQYQNKTTFHRENSSLPINMSMNQYSKNHIQQGKIQNRIRPQMQKEKKRMHTSGFPGEGFSTRPLTNSNMRGGDRKQVISQNMYFDHLGSMHSPRFGAENSRVSAGNTQQLLPIMYPVNDPRRHSSMPMNSSSLNFRPPLPYGGGVPGMDMGEMTSPNEPAAFSSCVSDMMTCKGESTHRGMASNVMNQGGPMIQLYYYLDECYEQWRCLEKDRKKTEMILAKTFVGKRTATVTNTKLPKTPPNATRVDNLIVNQMREQARVASLLERMESLHNITLHVNIQTALNRHHKALCIAQARRREEITNMSKHQRQRANFSEDRDTLLLVIALKDLAATTRKLRNALWCALQTTLPTPVKQDHHVTEAATVTERPPSPMEGYSFRF
ncbi:Meiosis-specific coiled-coil domain-containing protein MEIOC [Larimichthys crocea]|uniref:Meiosis-specific coiled-coil domain-containing protein MEIOC n=1 Tax=Larimichthys crocea TaxID=215358 RepID=A0A6G0HVW7_LARCR|nr:Meiosis-specific coiled-coil domain-containing protein MEIOC [Larimichthys crocea]